MRNALLYMSVSLAVGFAVACSVAPARSGEFSEHSNSAPGHNIDHFGGHDPVAPDNGLTDVDYDDNQRRVEDGTVDTSTDSCAGGCFVPDDVTEE